MGTKSKPMSKLTVAELRAESDRLAGEIAEIRKFRHVIANIIREKTALGKAEDDGS